MGVIGVIWSADVDECGLTVGVAAEKVGDVRPQRSGAPVRCLCGCVRGPEQSEGLGTDSDNGRVKVRGQKELALQQRLEA